jgi:hypothetical protein
MFTPPDPTAHSKHEFKWEIPTQNPVAVSRRSSEMRFWLKLVGLVRLLFMGTGFAFSKR